MSRLPAEFRIGQLGKLDVPIPGAIRANEHLACLCILWSIGSGGYDEIVYRQGVVLQDRQTVPCERLPICNVFGIMTGLSWTGPGTVWYCDHIMDHAQTVVEGANITGFHVS